MPDTSSLTRRRLLQTAPALLAVSPLHAASAPAASPQLPTILRQPDFVRLFAGEHEAEPARALERAGERWSAAGVELTCHLAATALDLRLHAPATALTRLQLRWRGAIPGDTLVLGDAWERSYGDLAWLPLQPERPLPWYCMLLPGGTRAGSTAAAGYGVRTGAAAFAFWQADPDGLSLWLDLRNGGTGVLLGDRELAVATIVTHAASPGESPFAATRALCHRMAPDTPLATHRGGLPVGTVFGSNDWYYAYGHNTPGGILRDADLMASLAPSAAGLPRPFTVIDDGYQDPKVFPDMAALARQISTRDVVPGIWIRPLRAPASTPAGWLLPPVRFGPHASATEGIAYDPTVPEARAAALAVVTEARGWGYRLLKHDFTTWELLGQWGFQMGASPTLPGWSFHHRSQTNAEIVRALYADIRKAAGEDRIVLGCNTVGHLAAGLFDAQRTGDDVSGKQWERTRRMGVNTLAFRLPQHNVLFALDADCVPFTREIPSTLTLAWLRAVAATGSVLLVSPEPGAVGEAERHAAAPSGAWAAATWCASGSR